MSRLLPASRLIGWLVLSCVPGSAQAQGLATPWDSVGRIMGVAGTAAGNAYRYTIPRSDLEVHVGDVVVSPALALTTWAGFGAMEPDTVVLGDLVVTANELPPVLRQLADDAIEVTGIHNHLAGESPRITYVHFFGRGSPLELARKMRRAVARTAAPLPVTAGEAGPTTIDTAAIFGALGARGRAHGAVVQFTFDHIQGDVTIEAFRVPLGTATAIALQVVSDDRLLATGDFAVLESKVGALLDVLARHGITATALHNHFIGESPSVYYLHFWADGPKATVLGGLRAALDAAR